MLCYIRTYLFCCKHKMNRQDLLDELRWSLILVPSVITKYFQYMFRCMCNPTCYKFIRLKKLANTPTSELYKC